MDMNFKNSFLLSEQKLKQTHWEARTVSSHLRKFRCSVQSWFSCLGLTAKEHIMCISVYVFLQNTVLEDGKIDVIMEHIKPSSVRKRTIHSSEKLWWFTVPLYKTIAITLIIELQMVNFNWSSILTICIICWLLLELKWWRLF